MITRLVVALAFVGLSLSAASGRSHAQDAYQGTIGSCSDLGADYVDASDLVTITSNDGTYLSYDATVAVTAVLTGGDNANVYPPAASGVDLSSSLNSDGTVPAISGFLFCSLPGDANPVVEELTCETDATLCEPPVDQEPTCETDATLCGPPVDQEPGTCPGGADGYPECNPQIDAEVNLSVDCANDNQDGTYTVGGVVSVTNQSEHDQDIRITEVVGPTPDSESFLLGQEILNGQTLSYAFQSVASTGGDAGAQFVVSSSVSFESVQGRGSVREPRGDAEEFYLDAKDPCFTEPPVDETPTCETDATLCETPVVETPVVETPVVETPVVETPVVETPVDDASDVETPVGEQSVDETPVAKTPVAASSSSRTQTVGGEPVVAFPNTGSGPVDGSGSDAAWISVLFTAVLILSTTLGLRTHRKR